MAEFIKRVLLLVFSQRCYDEFFINFNFFDGPCLKATLSKFLGLGIVAGSVMVKVPQITKILNNKTAEGISFLSTILDLFAITSNVAYNVIKGFPFSAWGEGFFLATQTGVIGALVLFFGRSGKEAFFFIVSYAAVCVLLMGGYTSVDVLWSLQALNVPILCVSKCIQAFTNFKNQSTGQLSAITCFMLFLGAVARIFTTIQETGDGILILTFVCTSILNGIIAGQVLWYWNSDKNKKEI
ncbi:mannose-P-dolichol utilization defect 1 protein homolog [Periplaneta americana]|uniref:mannose-P-dolichol utilization defect 1 protein homolog n=1 Tax=Periplaneta americana TaxID=6978 RepID=UPI0037E77F7C